MKKRGFVLTNWNLNDNESYQEIMEREGIQYLAYGLEHCPDTGKKHHQCFLYFYNPRATTKNNLKKIGEWWGETHCYVYGMLGNFQQNDAYCKKESSLTKLGEEPEQGARGDIKENCKLISTGQCTPDDLLMLDPIAYNQYHRTYVKIHQIYMRTQWRTEMTKGFWYWGETGTGKSHLTFEDYNPKTHYVKDMNVMWWDGYTQQEVVVFNEFRGQIKYSELLDLCDKYPKAVPIRGAESIPFISKKIIINSAEPPQEVFSNLSKYDKLEQLKRRFSIVNLLEIKDSTGIGAEQKCSEVILDSEQIEWESEPDCCDIT